MQPFIVFNHLLQKTFLIMKIQARFRLLTLIGVFALLSVSLSSCFYGGSYGGRYGRPSYGYGYSYQRPRVYSAPPRRYYSHNDNSRNRGGRSYGGGNRSYRGGSSRNGRH
jgi:hypothetical protein